MGEHIIDRQRISDMLYGQEKYISEFCTAAIESFQEFLNDYSIYLKDRDIENLRRAGHKIKPVAQMLDVHELVSEYEHAKNLLMEDKPDKQLQVSVEKIESICLRVIGDFKRILSSDE